jgi:hypothetical protein
VNIARRVTECDPADRRTYAHVDYGSMDLLSKLRSTSHTALIRPKVASAFREIPQVEAVFLFQHGDLLRVFTVVNQEDEQVYSRIFKRERELATKFRPRRFDFQIVTRRGQPIEGFLTIPPARKRTTPATGAMP